MPRTQPLANHVSVPPQLSLRHVFFLFGGSLNCVGSTECAMKENDWWTRRSVDVESQLGNVLIEPLDEVQRNNDVMLESQSGCIRAYPQAGPVIGRGKCTRIPLTERMEAALGSQSVFPWRIGGYSVELASESSKFPIPTGISTYSHFCSVLQVVVSSSKAMGPPLYPHIPQASNHLQELSEQQARSLKNGGSRHPSQKGHDWCHTDRLFKHSTSKIQTATIQTRCVSANTIHNLPSSCYHFLSSRARSSLLSHRTLLDHVVYIAETDSRAEFELGKSWNEPVFTTVEDGLRVSQARWRPRADESMNLIFQVSACTVVQALNRVFLTLHRYLHRYSRRIRRRGYVVSLILYHLSALTLKYSIVNPSLAGLFSFGQTSFLLMLRLTNADSQSTHGSSRHLRRSESSRHVYGEAHAKGVVSVEVVRSFQYHSEAKLINNTLYWAFSRA
ncbi:hypothetical protein PM082_021700, partial [Marasmius tenuissimus]